MQYYSSNTDSENSTTSRRNSYFEHSLVETNTYSVSTFLSQDLKAKLNSNAISTSKYTWLNFFPKILIEQFSKMANIYFLFIAFLQSINSISISNGQPLILFPLFLVVSINGMKNIFEDYQRKISDEEENNRDVQIFEKVEGKYQFQNRKWKDIREGDIVKINQDQYFPADLIMISSSEENHCYVETKNLDGETNLKYKSFSSDFCREFKTEESLESLHCKIICKSPDDNIYDFEGKLKLIKDNSNENEKFTNLLKDEFFVDKHNFLLRGSSLKQTDYIFGIAIYTGHHTKIMKNSPKSKNKESKLEKLMHKRIFIIFILQICMSIIATVFLLIWLDKNKVGLEQYIFVGSTNQGFHNLLVNGIFKMGTWILIFSNLIPISLLVTMELIKYVQGIFITWDVDLYDLKSRSRAIVQTSTLNEELGQVNYIFSDKTGTLTKNYMEFKKASIGNILYGDDNNKKKTKTLINFNDEDNFKTNKNCEEEKKVKNCSGNISNMSFNDTTYINHLNDSLHENHENIHLFLLNLSLCHSANTNYKSISNNNKSITENFSNNFPDDNTISDFKDLKLQASSPDEIALINFAKYSGYEFIFRNESGIVYLNINSVITEFKILHCFDYTSERKRMSIIVQDKMGKIFMFSKGADNFIFPRITKNKGLIDSTKKILIENAREGLRTLVIAYKELSYKELDEFNSKYANNLNTIGKKGLDDLYNSYENDYFLLGSTAIEDHLQDNVSRTLKRFLGVGIKIWMLTGDKMDTAKSIAFSCGLISHEYVIFELEENMTFDSIETNLFEYYKIIVANPNNKFALIVGMEELSKILGDDSLKNHFYELSARCDSVLCCRVTPKQKAQIVQLYKRRQPDKVTLAIGDGANDVNMITSAHIGVGILGVEGLQAARASDYAIGQFSFLEKLLFVHGRESYRKNTFVVCYNFYKNALFVMPQFWFGSVSLFSGQTLYDPWLSQIFNIVFTSIPIIWYGCMDSEMDHSKLLKNTNYYKQGIQNYLFGNSRFWKYVIIAFIQSFFIFYFSFNILSESIDNTGKTLNLWTIGHICYFIVVIVANLKIIFSTKSHSYYSFIFCILTISSFILVDFITSLSTYFENFGTFNIIYVSPKIYMLIILTTSIILMFDISLSKLPIMFGLYDKPYHSKNIQEQYDEDEFSYDQRSEISEIKKKIKNIDEENENLLNEEIKNNEVKNKEKLNNECKFFIKLLDLLFQKKTH